MSVTGNYHEIGVFLDALSKLARIVNVTNIKMGTPRLQNEKLRGGRHLRGHHLPLPAARGAGPQTPGDEGGRRNEPPAFLAAGALLAPPAAAARPGAAAADAPPRRRAQAGAEDEVKPVAPTTSTSTRRSASATRSRTCR